MTDKQQIEELRKFISQLCCNSNCDNCKWRDVEEGSCLDYFEATALYNANYRKVPEGAVVLTQDEKKKLLHEMYEQGKFDAIAELQMDGKVVMRGGELTGRLGVEWSKGYAQARKETTKEFTKTLISLLWEEEKGETITIKDLHSVIRSVAKLQYGVEVDE